MLFPSGNPFKCHEEVLYLQPLISPKRFDIFIGDLVVDVDTVAVVVENCSGKNMPYVVLAMNDGSHLCSCRTLQILGLCCRHIWMAMRLSCKFRFHIGILNQHWLVEQGRSP